MRALFPVPLLALLLAACGASQAGKSSLIEQTQVGKARCQVDPAGEHRLFLVEWDATDLSSFEARADRDVVFVKYEGCTLKVLHGCSDDGVAGRHGTYGQPKLTSGNVESVAIKNHSDLSTKLPLGIASFGGELSSGKELELKYFVSGTRTSDRNEIYRADLADMPRCRDATHFVASYNLGAFRLLTHDATRASVGARVSDLGATGSHAEEASAAKEGGNLAACTTFDQTACRVPIRVALRPITDGSRPSAAPQPPGPVSGPGPALADAQSLMTAAQLRIGAEQKLLAGDGGGCLVDLDRADNLHREGITPQSRMMRARCEMRSGKCDEGKKHYREALAAWTRASDTTGLATDASLDAQAQQMAQATCPVAAAGGVSFQAGAVALLQKITVASQTRDVAACIAHGDALLAASRAPGASGDPMMKQAAPAGLRTAAECAGNGGRCDDGRRLWRAFAEAFDGSKPGDADRTFKEQVPACAK